MCRLWLKNARPSLQEDLAEICQMFWLPQYLAETCQTNAAVCQCGCVRQVSQFKFMLPCGQFAVQCVKTRNMRQPCIDFNVEWFFVPRAFETQARAISI